MITTQRPCSLQHNRETDVATFERFGPLDIPRAFQLVYKDGRTEDCTPFQRFRDRPPTKFYRVDWYPSKTVRADMGKVGRNDPCPCGSGEKYKRCCGR